MSPLEAETASTNGAKSRGPVTPEGQAHSDFQRSARQSNARSSRNAIKHGLTAANVCLSHESEEAFVQHRAAYFDRFQPASQPEADLVETMAVARWRLNRLFAMEAHMLEQEVVEQYKNWDPDHPEEGRVADAFKQLADNGTSLAMLSRYEGQINRTYDRAFKQLMQLKKQPPPPPASAIQQNEPKLLLLPAPDPPQILARRTSTDGCGAGFQPAAGFHARPRTL